MLEGMLRTCDTVILNQLIWVITLKIINLYTLFLFQNKISKGTISKLEVINAELQQQTLNFSRKLEFNTTLSTPIHNSSNSPLNQSVRFSTQTPGFGGLIPPNNEQVQTPIPVSPGRTQSAIASDTRTIACQTLETAFVPCEACSRVQLTLQDVSTVVTEVCKSRGLPSAMAKYRARISTETAMSAADIARWGGELGKDLESIRNHLQDLLDQIQPLEQQLAAANANCTKLEAENERIEKEVKKERNVKEIQSKQHAAKLKEVERDHAQAILVVQRNWEETQKGKKSIEDELMGLKRELHKQYEALKELGELVLITK